MPKLRKQKKSPIAGHSREYIASRIMRGRALDRGYSLSEMARKRVSKKEIMTEHVRDIAKAKWGWVGDPWTGFRTFYGYGIHLGLFGKFPEILEKALKRKKKPRVLDLGCGHGEFLQEIGSKFIGKFDLHGLTLARQPSTRLLSKAEEKIAKHREKTPNPKAKNDVFTGKELNYLMANKPLSPHRKMMLEELGLKTHVGLAETYKWGKLKFDLIFSTQAMIHAINPEQALKNTLSHLALNGEAFIEIHPSQNSLKKREMISWLEKKGIEVKTIKEPEIEDDKIAYKFTRKK